MFFNIGGGEILVIAMIALIAVGPEQLPGVLRKLGRTMGQVRNMAAGLREEFMAGADELTDLTDPKAWFGGSGTADDPVIRRGYADLVHDESPSGNGSSGSGSSDGAGPTGDVAVDGAGAAATTDADPVDADHDRADADPVDADRADADDDRAEDAR